MNIRLIKYMLVVFSAVLFTSNVYSQEVRNLSLQETIKIGLENSYLLHSSRMAVLSTEARLSEVNALRLPSLGLNATYTRLSSIPPFSIQTPFGDFDITQDIVNTYNFQLSLQQPIFTGFRLVNSSKIAEYNLEATRQDYAADEKTLVYNIKNAYWNLYKAGEVKKVVDENVAQVRAHLEDIQNLFKQGLSTRNDLLRVQVQLSEAQLRQIDANNALRVASVNLSNVINIPLTTGITITDSVEARSDIIPALDLLTEKAYSTRPELKALDFRVKASETAINVAQASWWPQIFLQGNYNYARPNQRVFPSTDEFKGTWDVSVALQMNLWNWGQTSSQTTQAESQYEQTKDTYQTLRNNVALELTQNYLNVLRSKERILVAEESVGQAEENYRVTSEKFKNGLVLNTDLIDAEVDLLQARTNYVQSLVDYELAKASLERSTGE